MKVDPSGSKPEASADQKIEVESTTNISPRILASVFEYLVFIPLKDREDKKYVEEFVLGVLEDAHHPLIGKVN